MPAADNAEGRPAGGGASELPVRQVTRHGLHGRRGRTLEAQWGAPTGPKRREARRPSPRPARSSAG
eukprot:7984359-Pyramimonas_sp.AAC.1